MAKITLLKGECDLIETKNNCIRGGEKKISGKCIGCDYFSVLEPKIKINVRDYF